MMKKWLKQGAMFGLDARIALAVLAIIALSIGLAKEKQLDRNETQETEFALKITEATFLKNWASLYKEGYYTSAKVLAGTSYTATDLSANAGTYGAENFRYYDFTNKTPNTTSQADFVNSANGKTYTNVRTAYSSSSVNDRLKNKSILVYYNAKKDTNLTTSAVFNSKATDIFTRISLAYLKQGKQEGAVNFAIIDNSGKFPVTDRAFLSPRKDGFGEPIYIYYIVELATSKYNAMESVLHVVTYSTGLDKTLNTVLPKNIEDLKNFTPSGDDMFNIFSDKNIYLDAKLESEKRLEEIKNRVMQIADNNYISRISLCNTQATLTADCDLNADTKFDHKDISLIVNLNPFPKSTEDTKSTYLNSNNWYDHTTNSANYTFLRNLGLPEYYAYDLFGNHLRYNSNVKDKAVGPYTMEVWY